MPTEYVTIKIPEALIKQIEELVVSSNFGYRNRTEFIVETLRLRLQQLKKELVIKEVSK